MSCVDDLDDIVKEFLIESEENLDQLDRDLVALEEHPESEDLLSSIFRTIHTIKGTCGFLSFTKLEDLTHVGESLLSLLRDGDLVLTSKLTDALLAMIDAVRTMLTTIENTGNDGDNPYQDLMDRLKELQQPAESSPDSQSGDDASGDQTNAAPGEKESADAQNPVASPPGKTGVSADGIDMAVSVSPAAAPTGNSSPSPNANSEVRGRSIAESAIRVDVSLLDKLMNLVGELVLTRNQILQYTQSHSDTAFLGTSQRLNLITTELQEGVMKTRMQPIGNIWGKLPRVVRDLAQAFGKQIRLEMEGNETELDKTLIEAIKDPLTHLVRNAVDHGIESPEERVRAGKPREGCVSLRAYHEGGHVNIEISDDGAGIDMEKIKAAALERGVITQEQASRMGDTEALHIIFMAGFSTAQEVTNVSGRGVGMDVVKTNVERIGGTVDVHTKPGHGSMFRIKIPLTLAIIPALLITSGGEQFAIPQVSLLELVRLDGAQKSKRIEMIHGAPVFRLRGRLLPLVNLPQELQMRDGEPSYGDDNGETINIVIVQANDRPFGLVVDEINDTEEIVVKPLGKILKGSGVFAGATIMGDGRVALILDIMRLAQRASILSEGRDRTATESGKSGSGSHQNRQTLLLVGLGEKQQLAIPLEMVARLEEIPQDKIEWAAGREVVQYRGVIMPIIRLSEIFDSQGPADGQPVDPMPVVVYSKDGRSVGLAVDRVIDIVEEEVKILANTTREGILQSAVVHNRVTDFLDVHGIIRKSEPAFFAEENPQPQSTEDTPEPEMEEA